MRTLSVMSPMSLLVLALCGAAVAQTGQPLERYLNGHRTPPGTATTVTQKFFEGPGTTVELPRLTTREERLSYLHWMDPYHRSPKPFKEIPRFIQLFNSERTAHGFTPYPKPED